jgi:hypothetical protein
MKIMIIRQGPAISTVTLHGMDIWNGVSSHETSGRSHTRNSLCLCPWTPLAPGRRAFRKRDSLQLLFSSLSYTSRAFENWPAASGLQEVRSHDGERDMDGTNRTSCILKNGMASTSNNACGGACSGELAQIRTREVFYIRRLD